MPATIDYKEVLQEVKERTCRYDTQPYAQAYENSFTYAIPVSYTHLTLPTN